MKRFISIALIVIICTFGVFYLLDLYKINKAEYEFKVFQSFLNETFFPVLNESFEHLDQVADELEGNTFIEWYLEADGMNVNLAFQEKIEETKAEVKEKVVKGENTNNIKNNILNQIVVLQETFELLYTTAEADRSTYTQLHDTFTSKIEKLLVLSEQMEKLMEVNSTKKEKADSF